MHHSVISPKSRHGGALTELEALVFDASGTLFNDISQGLRVTNSILHKHGIAPLTLTKFRRSIREPYWRFLQDCGIKSVLQGEVTPLVLAEYDGGSVRPFPDALSTLHALKRKGLSLAIASGTPGPIIRPLLKKLSMDLVFASVVALEDSREEKPSPEPIRCALDMLHVSNEKAAYIGDMREDIMSSKAAGVLSIAISRRGSWHTRALLEPEKPDFLIRRLASVLKLVGP